MNSAQYFISLRFLTATLGIFLASADLASSQVNTDTAIHTLKIGGGGFIRGIDIECDQGVGQCNNSGTTTKVIRTDTYGAYWYNASATNPGNAGGAGEWQQLVTSTSLSQNDPMHKFQACATEQGCGVYEIRIAPSDTKILYMMMNGYVYKSIDQGQHWNHTNFSQVKSSNPNDGYAQFGPKMAVDPSNPNIVFVCTETNGCFLTTNGGESFSAVAGLSNAPTVGMLVVFDPNSNVIGGATQGVYISSYGTGVYHSVDGGRSWILTMGTPTTHQHMQCVSDGTLYLTDNNKNSNIYVYRGGLWKSYSTGSGWIASVAINPNNLSEIVAIGTSGSTSFTATSEIGPWSGYSRGTSRVATDIPWLAATDESWMTAGDIVYDPAQANAVFFAEGIGVRTTKARSYAGRATPWTSLSAGIEQLVSNWAISPPGGDPILTFWDRPAFAITNPTRYPTTHGVNITSGNLQSGWSADWASDASGTIIVLANTFGSSDTSGYSSDLGANWHTFAEDSPESTNKTYGGSIAAATSKNLVWIPTDDSPHENSPWYTMDGGLNWTPVRLPGIPTSSTTGWGNAYYLDLQRVAADRVNIGTFYLYNSGEGKGNTGGGIWKCLSGGAHCSRVSSTIFPNSYYNAQMRSVPGKAGNLFFTSGKQTCPCPSKDGSFFRSADGGATWTNVSGVKDVWTFGFGKAKPAGVVYPTIFIYGWVYGVGGLWRSDDNASTWKQLSNLFPNNSLDQVKVVEGDNHTYGTVYIGLAGSGFIYGTLN